MPSLRTKMFYPLLAAALTVPQPIAAKDLELGDDTSRYANDGECDDKRFAGTGMTTSVLLEADVSRDASDCQAALDDGTIFVRGNQPRLTVGDIKWGDDSGEWANDSECDDIRFSGGGMADSLAIASIGKDASDCKTAYAKADLNLSMFFANGGDLKLIDFGDDTSDYANNGMCDDVRFTGEYATDMIYLPEDIGKDASDCKSLFIAGSAVWQAADLPMNLGVDPGAEEDGVTAADAALEAAEDAAASIDSDTI